MSGPQVRLRCGCVVAFQEGREPICPTHGRQGVARSLRMPPPRIRGCATGPHVTPLDLEPHRARFVVEPES